MTIEEFRSAVYAMQEFGLEVLRSGYDSDDGVSVKRSVSVFKAGVTGFDLCVLSEFGRHKLLFYDDSTDQMVNLRWPVDGGSSIEISSNEAGRLILLNNVTDSVELNYDFFVTVRRMLS